MKTVSLSFPEVTWSFTSHWLYAKFVSRQFAYLVIYRRVYLAPAYEVSNVSYRTEEVKKQGTVEVYTGVLQAGADIWARLP